VNGLPPWGKELGITRVRWIHVGATWPSTNKHPRNFKEIYLRVLGSVLSMESVWLENSGRAECSRNLNEGFDHLRRTKF
jgi:hypothetical protein